MAGIHAFTVDPTMYRYRCAGCGRVSLSVWDLDGEDHWSLEPGPSRVCGTWRLVAVVPPEKRETPPA